MTPWLPSAAPQWQLAGWTMLLFLGVGTAVAALGAAVRLACRRAAPNVRYALSLATLLALATTPIAVAAYLGTNGIPTIDVAVAQKPPAPPMDSLNLSPLVGEATIESRPSAEPVASIIDLHNLSTPREDLELPIATPNVSATPGQNPGLNDGVSSATAGSPSSAVPPSPFAAIIAWLPVVWLAGAPLTFALLAAGLVGSRHLRRTGLQLVEGPVADACRRLQRALGVTRRVALAACDHVAQPVLIGILRPTILLPAAAIAGWPPADLEMILLHELAHVRRWDNLVNLGQRLIESLLFFHPCVWLASRQVRRDREDCCDEFVVRHTNEPEAYATLLINVASSKRTSGRLHPRHTAAILAASTMAAHPLANRVRRILKIEDEPMRISRRMLVLILLLGAGVTAAAYRAAFAAPEPSESDAQETPDEPITVVYSADQIDHIPSRDWARLMSTPDAETAKIRWDFRHGEGARITGPHGFHDKIELILAGRGDEWPHYTKFVTGNAALIDAVDRVVESLTAGGDAGEERSDDAPDDAHSTDANAADDSDENDAAIIRRVYRFEDADQVKVADWMRLIANGSRGVEVRWLDDSSGLVISAPDSLHKQIADFLEASHRRASADAWNISALQAAIIKHQNQLDDVESELTEIEVLKEVALQAARNTTALDQAIEYELAKDPILKALQASVREIKSKVQQLQAAIQERVAPGQEEQLRMLQADQSSAEELLASYREKAEKEARERLKNAPNEALRAAIAEYNVRKQAAHKKRASVEATIADLEANLRALTESSAAAQSDQRASIDTAENDSTSQQDYSATLSKKLAQRKQDLAKVAEELRELEVLREVALQSGPGTSVLDRAVAEEIESDPKIKLYQEQLFALKLQIQQLQVSTRDAKNETLERYKAQYQELDQALATYRSQAEKEARERLSHMPDNWLLTAEAAYKARREPLIKKQTVIEAEIAALEVAIRRRTEESEARSESDDAPTDINVVLTTAYKIEDADRDSVREWLRGVDAQPDVTSRWHVESSILVLSAPRRVHSKLTDLINSRRLLRDPNAVPLEIPRPRAELELLQQQLASVVEELRKADKFERAARDHMSTPETIKAAVDDALNQDLNLHALADELAEAKNQFAAINLSDASEEQKEVQRQEATERVQILTGRLEVARDEIEQATRARMSQIDYRKVGDEIAEHKLQLRQRQAELKRSIADVEAQLLAIAEPATTAGTTEAASAESSTADPTVTRTYLVDDVGAVEFAGWVQSICTDHPGVPIRWFDRDKSRIVIAPEIVHKQIAEFLSKTRQATNPSEEDEQVLGTGAPTPPAGADSLTGTAADRAQALKQQEDAYQEARKLIADGQGRAALRLLNKIVARNNNFIEAHIARGDALQQMNFPPEAAEAYSRAIDVNGNSTAAYVARGKCYIAMEKFGEAMRDFDRVVELDPDNVDALAALGRLWLNPNGNGERALAFFDAAIEVGPPTAAIYRDRARAHAMFPIRNLDLALRDAKQAFELDPGDESQKVLREIEELKSQVQVYRDRAKAFAQDGHFLDAIENAQRLVNLEPTDESRTLLAEVRAQLEAARKSERQSSSAPAGARPADAAINPGASDEAAAADEETVEQTGGPGATGNETKLGSVDAPITFEPATAGAGDATMRGDGPPSDERYDKARRFLADGKPLDAIKILNKLLAEDSTLGEAWLAKGEALKALKYFPEAAVAYSRALELNASPAAAYTGRGETFMATTPPDYDMARNDFASAIDRDRDNPIALAALGHLCVKDAPQRAITFLSEALLLAPNNAAIYRDRALAHGKLGQFDQARDDVKKATELEPDNVDNEYTLKEIEAHQSSRAIEDQAETTPASAIGDAIGAPYSPPPHVNTVRIELPAGLTEANGNHIMRDLSAVGRVALTKDADRWIFKVETDIPNAKPIWETRMVDGVPEKVVRLISEPGGVTSGQLLPIGSPVAIPTTAYPTAATASPPAPEFRYDGKTFDEWRDAYRYELKDDRRIEAMYALAGFARAGRGRDAAAAILDIAGEYDFSTKATRSQEKFKQAILGCLAWTRSEHLTERDWLPLLIERRNADPGKWNWLGVRLLERFHGDSPEGLALLEQLVTSDDRDVAEAAATVRRWRGNGWLTIRTYDANKDGRITRNEQNHDQWERLVKADANGDEAVTEEEFAAAMAREREAKASRDP